MKKLSLLAAAVAVATSVFADSYVEFSSVGPDRYADGSKVLVGEVYALVWVKSGAEFKGFNAKGEVVDPETSKIVGAAKLAVDADCPHCPPTLFMLSGANADLAGTGSFSVYLFDTRIASTDDNGENRTVAVGGRNADSTFTVVNASTSVADNLKVLDTVKAGAIAEGAVATAVPEGTTDPVISAIKVEGGKVIVKVDNTFPFLQYGISAGKTPSVLDQTSLVEGVNGSSEGLTLVVDDPEDNRFFKVIRK